MVRLNKTWDFGDSCSGAWAKLAPSGASFAWLTISARSQDLYSSCFLFVICEKAAFSDSLFFVLGLEFRKNRRHFIGGEHER